MRLTLSELVLVIMALACIACSRQVDETVPIRSSAQQTALAEIGKSIFNDTAFSKNRDISCASCHRARHGFADPRPVSTGTAGSIGTRNAPSLIGLTRQRSFFWDGRESDVHLAVINAMTNPVEMGLGSASDVVMRLRQDRRYANLVYAHESASLNAVAEALIVYLDSLPASNSDFDRYRSNGDPSALSIDQRIGLDLFKGKAGCGQCHRSDGGSFTDHAFHHTGIGFSSVSGELTRVIERLGERRISGRVPLGHIVLADAGISQLGRFAVSDDPREIGAFKTPSLKNVAATPPYMHDGSIATLEEAVDREIYYRGLNRNSPINLSLAERAQLIAFLHALSDKVPAGK